MDLIAAASEEAGSNDLPLILSLVATAVALAGFALAALTAFQNRPSISVTANAMHQKQGDTWRTISAIVFVANTGRQPVALTDVAVCHAKGWNGWWQRRLSKAPAGSSRPALLRFMHDPEMLQVGGMKRYALPPQSDDFLEHDYVYAFVRDARDRVTYASKAIRRPDSSA